MWDLIFVEAAQMSNGLPLRFHRLSVRSRRRALSQAELVLCADIDLPFSMFFSSDYENANHWISLTNRHVKFVLA